MQGQGDQLLASDLKAHEEQHGEYTLRCKIMSIVTELLVEYQRRAVTQLFHSYYTVTDFLVTANSPDHPLLRILQVPHLVCLILYLPLPFKPDFVKSVFPGTYYDELK